VLIESGAVDHAAFSIDNRQSAINNKEGAAAYG
jgi:hypothetical protein